MKKLILAFILLFSGVTACFADAAEESAQRIANLEKMLKKVPGATGVADLDAYVNASAKAGTLAVANSVLLKGVTEGNVTPETIKALTEGLKGEKEALKESTKLAPKAVEGLKGLNPLKIGKAKKALDFGNTCTKIVTEETVYQTQVITNLVK